MGQPSSRLLRKHLSRSRANQEPATVNASQHASGFRWVDSRGYREAPNPTYVLPSDTEEYLRLNGIHFQLRYVFQGDYQAPITDDLRRGIKVLDVGCGTGIWSVELAKRFPTSTFTGTDISEDAFKETLVPPNCTFIIADTSKGLPFEDNTFDFVFQRLLIGHFPERIWTKVIQELVRVTKPGGFIELLECDTFLHDAGPATEKFHEQFGVALRARGVNPHQNSLIRPLLEAVSVTDIQQDYRSIPVGWGPEDIGLLFKASVVADLQSRKEMVITAMAICEEDFDENMTEAAREMGEYKSYMNFTSYYGKKPPVKPS